jgi:tRNA threonylcarbamoyladenosine biosynthesis protein TsaB
MSARTAAEFAWRPQASDRRRWRNSWSHVVKTLAIETATKHLGVALLADEALLGSFELLTQEYPHATELPDAVARVLKGAGLALEDVEAIAVDIGPGSFTGLRIGLSFMKGLTFGRALKVVGVPSLEVLAAGLGPSALPICPILDAKQQKVYAATYRLADGLPARQGDYVLGPVEEALRHAGGPTVFLGDGCAIYRDRILAACPHARVAPQETWLPRAAVLGRLGLARLRRGEADDPATLTPLYLYAQDCGVNLSQRRPTEPRTAVRTSPA